MRYLKYTSRLVAAGLVAAGLVAVTQLGADITVARPRMVSEGENILGVGAVRRCGDSVSITTLQPRPGDCKTLVFLTQTIDFQRVFSQLPNMLHKPTQKVMAVAARHGSIQGVQSRGGRGARARRATPYTLDLRGKKILPLGFWAQG